MWSSWASGMFPGQIATPPSMKTAGHSNGCKMITNGDSTVLMADLDVLFQEFIMECTHPSHDSVRQLFMIPCNGDRSDEIEEGRLF